MLTLLHPLVDACSAAVLFADDSTLARWFVYNVLAFALQLPLGVALDGLGTKWVKSGLALGCGLTALGAVTAVAGLRGWVPLVMVCTGNGLFHLTAGKWVLDATPGRSGPVGLFISTGALGLMAGMALGRSGCLWPIAVAALALIGGAVWQVRRGALAPVAERTGSPQDLRFGKALLAAGLFMLVTWRSWAGLLANRRTASAELAMLLSVAAVTWAGKAAGGFLADWLGRKGAGSRWWVTGASVVGSAVLVFAVSPESAAMWLGLLFVAQLATGPVLSLMRDSVGGKSGTAFGLNCFGLFAGSLA